jgi:hypothetical protein
VSTGKNTITVATNRNNVKGVRKGCQKIPLQDAFVKLFCGVSKNGQEAAERPFLGPLFLAPLAVIMPGKLLLGLHLSDLKRAPPRCHFGERGVVKNFSK